MTHYRIFVSDAGMFRHSEQYTYVAEFADQLLAKFYVKNMCNSGRFKGRDIIIKMVETEVDPREGSVESAVSAAGEFLTVDGEVFD